MGTAVPYYFTSKNSYADESRTKNDRPNFGCIGVGNQGHIWSKKWKTDVSDLGNAASYGDVVAVCDVDRKRAETASDNGKRAIYEDYRKLLERKDIDAVTISTPDHWHTKIAIDAMRAGKDVYCQKPLTLTIDEGKLLCKVAKETNRVFQVGTQQRSTNDLFLKAVAMCHLGRLGTIRRVTCVIGDMNAGGPFKKSKPPLELNWDMWLGQTPKVEYIKERSHGSFRSWYEYSGGVVTDWGAHHVDIAQWAIGMDHSGPHTVEPLSFTLPVPFEKGYPKVDDCFNTVMTFKVKCLFPNDVEMIIRHDTDGGVLVEGDKGRILVNRGRLVGKPAEELKDNPIPEEVMTKLRNGKPVLGRQDNPWNCHMANFVACMRDRTLPVSNVFSCHRTITTCHLVNIAIRLNRKLTWNPDTEQIVGDEEAQAFQKREQRAPYAITG